MNTSKDVLLLVPLDSSLTPNQAREAQAYLRGELPECRLIVIPFPANLAVLSIADLEEILKEED